ncbi:MAG: hypothetical protein ACXV4D_08970 [Ilumatobacteraceae bacterium]
MTMLLAYDHARLDALRATLDSALDDLRRVRSDDLAAADAMRVVRAARRSLGDVWLPRITAVLTSKSMTAPVRTSNNDGSAARPGPAWLLTVDPGVLGPGAGANEPRMYGPELPGSRSFGQVLAGIMSGELVPMTAPVDADGRAGARYTSIAFAPGIEKEVGHTDLTSTVLKLTDFASDGLPVGWRETKGMTIFYLSNTRAISSVHILSAYDRDSGPDTLVDLTEEATVSGYLVVKQESGTAEVNVQIGPGVQDPTQSFPIISSTTSAYSGVFYPDAPPDFRPITRAPRFVSPADWTFTTSASPMVDGWGTWGL